MSRAGVVAAVVVAAVVLVVAAARFAPYSFDITESGRTGLTVNADGDHVVLVHVCSVTITHTSVSLLGDEADWDQPIVFVGEYSTRVPLFRGIHEINLGAPSWRWRGPSTVVLDRPGETYSIDSHDQNNGFTSGLEPTHAQVAGLRPGQVLIGIDDADGAKVVTREAFEGEPCSPTYGGSGTNGRL